MPGPQTRHKGVVYGDDEINAPKPNRQPELGPPVRRRPQHTQTGGPRAATPQGLTALRTPGRRNGVRVWGAVHVGTKSRESCPSGSSRAPAYAGPRSRLLPHTPAAGRAEGHAYYFTRVSKELLTLPVMQTASARFPRKRASPRHRRAAHGRPAQPGAGSLG